VAIEERGGARRKGLTCAWAVKATGAQLYESKKEGCFNWR